MAIGNIHGQKGGAQSVDNVFPTPDGNIPLNALQKTGGEMTGDINMNSQAVTNVKDAVNTGDAANLKTVRKEAKKIANESWSTKVVTLPGGSWGRNNQQIVNCEDVTPDNDIIVAPAPSSYDAYYEAGVRVIAQGQGSLTFKYVNGQPGTLQVNVLIKKVLV